MPTNDEFNKGFELGFADIKLTHSATLEFIMGYRRGMHDLAKLKENNGSTKHISGLVDIAAKIKYHVKRSGCCHAYMLDNYHFMYYTKERSHIAHRLVGKYNSESTKEYIIEDVQSHLQELAEC